VDNCNLSCDYCFAKPNNPKNHLSTETFDAFYKEFTRYISDMNTKNIGVYLFGGEPLANKKVMMDIIAKLSTNKRFELHLITNATLLDEDTAMLLKNPNVSVGISIDGLQRTTDSHRRFFFR
jgi:Arylsulfatase regulator (Fe-S oxidoreductase)